MGTPERSRGGTLGRSGDGTGTVERGHVCGPAKYFEGRCIFPLHILECLHFSLIRDHITNRPENSPIDDSKDHEQGIIKGTSCAFTRITDRA